VGELKFPPYLVLKMKKKLTLSVVEDVVGGGQTTRSCQLRHTAFWLNSFAASSNCLPCGCFSFLLADGQSESVHNETVNDNNTTINNNTVMWTAGQTQKEHGGVVVSKSVAGKKNLQKSSEWCR